MGKVYFPPEIESTTISAPLDVGRVKAWNPNGNESLDLYAAVEDAGARATADTLKKGDVIALSPEWGPGYGVQGRAVGNINIPRAAVIGDLPNSGKIIFFDYAAVTAADEIAALAELHDIVAGNHRADTSAGSAAFKQDVTLLAMDGLKSFSDKQVGLGILITADTSIATLFPYNNKANNPDAADYKARVQMLIQTVDSRLVE